MWIEEMELRGESDGDRKMGLVGESDVDRRDGARS